MQSQATSTIFALVIGAAIGVLAMDTLTEWKKYRAKQAAVCAPSMVLAGVAK